MCAIDDAEYSDVWLEERPTARKPWKCIECYRTIAAGEQYLRVKSLYDGQWDTMQTCRHCDAAGTWLRAVCGGYPRPRPVRGAERALGRGVPVDRDGPVDRRDEAEVARRPRPRT